MTTTRFARYIALPAVSAGILGAAALGLAGMANAGTYPTHDPSPRPGLVATPDVYAQPPVLVYPGGQWHRHHGGSDTGGGGDE
jgi:hypothetical protein